MLSYGHSVFLNGLSALILPVLAPVLASHRLQVQLTAFPEITYRGLEIGVGL